MRGNLPLWLLCALGHACARVPPPLDPGSDPYRIVAVEGGFVGLLRGRSQVVLLDEKLQERARASAPGSPTGIAVAPDGEILVVGELSPTLARYRVAGGALRKTGEVRLARPGRDVAVGPETWILDEERLSTLGGAEEAVGHGCVDIEWIAPGYLIINCVLDHSILVRAPDGTQHRVTHDGPIWSFAARVVDGKLQLAAGGIEDHPLDRRDGAFGYVDSFLFQYSISNRIETISITNLSQHDVVTPKAIAFAGPHTMVVAGAGGEKMARVSWGESPTVTTAPLAPGTAALAGGSDGKFAFANPLLDAFVKEGEPPRPIAPPGEERLGEALLFTTIIAPNNTSDGKRSRFTCEACHFEGYGDGRTHFSGRGEIRVTTKPLFGLGNNAPFFSRALDPNLPEVVHAEFRAAAVGGGGDPWFTLRVAEHDWLRALGVGEESLAPEKLRAALTRFLVRFHHRPNPYTLERSRFTDEERRGAGEFSARCASCHEARRITSQARTVPFAEWEGVIFGGGVGPVWARADYRKTGVEPYVHPEGARVPSLRRLYKKWPYLTNGSAKSLDELLARVRVSPTFSHAGGEGEPLDEATRARLRAFLLLL